MKKGVTHLNIIRQKISYTLFRNGFFFPSTGSYLLPSDKNSPMIILVSRANVTNLFHFSPIFHLTYNLSHFSLLGMGAKWTIIPILHTTKQVRYINKTKSSHHIINEFIEANLAWLSTLKVSIDSFWYKKWRCRSRKVPILTKMVR